ncbi:MAG: TolC family protein, partial [bacterium]
MKQGLVLVIAVVLLFTTVRVSALTLQEGLGIVKEKSRDITISKAVEEQAREEVSLARSPLFPTLDVFATQTWLQDQPMAKFGPTGPASSVPLSEKEYQTVGFQVNQLVYDFGKTYSGLRASKYNVTLRETGTLRVGNSAALEFIEAYLDVLESEKMVQVDREEADRLIAHRRDAQALYDEGVVTRNDVLQAEVVLADAQQRLLTAENLRAVRASRINSILLKPLNEEVRVEEVSVSPSPGMGLEEAWNIAGQERPEIREVETAIRAREEEQKAVKAEFFPTLYLSGGYKYEDNRYMVHEDNWSIVA